MAVLGCPAMSNRLSLARRLVTSPIGSVALVAATALLLPRSLATASPPSPTRIPGLTAEASVVTDRWGIPHIRASNLDDLYRAWGWVTARDRLWQMVWTRGSGEGRTHRWLGNRALQADGGAQLFRLSERARAIWQRERRDPRVRAALEHYCAGVNAYLADCRSGSRAWPVELARLHERPRDWTPEDCVLVVLGMGVTLDLDFPELREAQGVAEHGAAWFSNRRRFEGRWMYDTIPDSASSRFGDTVPVSGVGTRDTPTGARARSPEVLSCAARRQIADALAAFPPHDADGASRASNEFVVGARRSASGRPILANDPHLGLATPGAFHVVHVSVPGVVDAVGAEVEGLPIIASGRNPRVAWGVTALSADVVDVYADTLSADGRRVRRSTPDGRAEWVPVEIRPFELSYRVLGVRVPVPAFVQARRYTPHGPVLVWEPKRRLAFSARWTAMEDRVRLDKLLGLERVTSAQEVVERLATLVTPCFNVVAADASGEARFRSVGLLPVRASEAGPGPLPSDGLHEWTGFVPAERMPQWRVPPAGSATNANNRPIGGAYAFALPRFDWAHDRARRIAQRLDGDRSVTVEDAASVQNDIYSLAAQRFLPLLLRNADASRDTLSPRLRAALDTLRGWDGYARRSKVAPTLYRAWIGALQRRSGLEGLPGLAFAALSGEAPEALTVPGTPSLREAPERAAVAALAMALDTLTARLGPDLADWRYARAHQARFRHPLSALDSRARWEAPLMPEDGDNATPSVGPSRLPWSTEVVHGPAFRHVVDLARPLVSYGVVAPWNSAAFAPMGERDLRVPWANHAYVPFHMDWARIDAVALDRVRLSP